MIKPGYSLMVVAPPRGTLRNQGLVVPSRGTKNNQGLVAPLITYSNPHLPILRPFHPHPPRAWRMATRHTT